MKWPSWLAGKGKGGEFTFGPREKAWTVLVVAVVVGAWGYRAVVAPQAGARRRAKSALSSAENELTRLEAQRPDLEARRTQVDVMRAQAAGTLHELEQLEEGLLNRQDLDLLLERVVADRKRFQLLINAVKPLKDEAEKGSDKKEREGPDASAFYRRLAVQIDTYAAFDSLIAYIKALELQSPYQRVKGLTIKIEGQEMVRPRALITLHTLLADAPEQVAQRREEVFATTQQMAQRPPKDPFLAREKPKEEQVAVGLELSGVFGAGSEMAAVINGEPYQVGDVVQGKRIVAILPDRVVLEQGSRRFLLYGQRVGE